MAVHERQPHAVSCDRRKLLAIVLKVGQVVFAEAEKHAHVRRPEAEAGDLLGVASQPLVNLGRRMVFNEVRELGEEDFTVVLGRPLSGAKGEQFLELVQNQHRSDRLAVPSLQPKTAPMEKFPERFVGLRERRLRDARPDDRIGQRRFDLPDEGLRCGLVIEPDIDRQKSLPRAAQGKARHEPARSFRAPICRRAR